MGRSRIDPESFPGRTEVAGVFSAGDAARAVLTEATRDGTERERPTIRVIPKKLYKIGEVMRHSGLSRQTIHNYTMLGLLTEDERTESGHRLYGEGVFERIERIKAAL